jgi:hypothetical protein
LRGETLERIKRLLRRVIPWRRRSSPVSPKEIRAVAPVLKRLVYGERAARAALEEYGVSVVPVHFYSNTPSIAEIESSFEYEGGQPPYANAALFRPDVMRETLERLIPFAGEFSPPAEGDEERGERFFWRNTQFSFSDAMSYYCFIRATRPTTIVEIGGGFSTLVACEAVARNGAGIIHVIDPFPRRFLERPDVRLHTTRVQDVGADFLNDLLRDGDILFIDSTHTVKTGSDCLHIYLRLLPAIRRKILVHVHDVFLPFGLPKELLLDQQIYWTEQYLLMALLLDNPKAAVLFGSAWNAHANLPQLEQLMGGRSPAGGGSLWFRYEGS